MDQNLVNLYFMPIFPISTPPTNLGDRGESGFFLGGEAYVDGIKLSNTQNLNEVLFISRCILM